MYGKEELNTFFNTLCEIVFLDVFSTRVQLVKELHENKLKQMVYQLETTPSQALYKIFLLPVSLMGESPQLNHHPRPLSLSHPFDS